MRYGYHLHHVLHHVLVTDCPKANQGKKSHKDVEAVLINHFNIHTHITATKAKFFPGDKLQTDIFLSGVTTIDNPAARNWYLEYLDVTSTNPMGATNQEFINRAAPGRQPGPEEHDPRNDVLTSAKRAEERKHAKYDRICTATGSVYLVTFRARNDGRSRCLHRGCTCSSKSICATRVFRRTCCWYCKLKKDIPFALRRGTIAQVTTHHHLALDGFAWLLLASRLRLASARSSAEDEELPPALNRRATGWRVGIVKQSLRIYYARHVEACALAQRQDCSSARPRGRPRERRPPSPG